MRRMAWRCLTALRNASPWRVGPDSYRDAAALSPFAIQEKYKDWLSYLKLDNTMKLDTSCDVPLKLEPPADTAWVPIQEASEWPEVP